MTETRIAKDAMLAEFDGEDSILLDVDAKRYHRLNATAAFIWKALEHDRSDAEIVLGLVNEFEVTHAKAVESVRRFVGELATRGLLRGAATPRA